MLSFESTKEWDFEGTTVELLASFCFLNAYHTWNWGGLWGLRDPPETQKSQTETPPETPLKSSGIATTLKSDSNPPKNFGDRPPYA